MAVPQPIAPLRQSEVLEELEAYVRAVLVQEKKRRKVTYAELSRRLQVLGIAETPDRLNRKINRQRFQAGFFLACLKALGVEVLAFGDLDLSPDGRAARLAREKLEEIRRDVRRRRPKAAAVPSSK